MNYFLGCPAEQLLEETWLTNDNVFAEYTCPSCNDFEEVEVSLRVPDAWARELKLECSCGNTKIFQGTGPRRLNIMYKITFEKNGRKGVRTSFSNGHSFVRSQTKENVMRGISSKSVLTPKCQEATEQAKDKLVHQRKKELQHYLQGGKK